MFNTDRGDCTAVSRFEIIVIAASAGAHEPLKQVVSALPGNLAASVLVCHHLHQLRPELLSRILQRHTMMKVKCVENGERLTPGVVYTVLPGYFPMVNADRTVSTRRLMTPVSNPADLLFESVALICKERAIGVVLSGLGADGASGVRKIKAARGRVFVQEEKTCAYFGMPGAAISTGCVDFVLPPLKIASALAAFVMVSGAADLFRVPLPSWARLVA